MVKSGLVAKIIGMVAIASYTSCKEVQKVGYAPECAKIVQKEKEGYRQVCETFVDGPGDHGLFKLIKKERDEKLRSYNCIPCEEWECYKTPVGEYFMHVEPKCVDKNE